jgi:hypothetical protein
MRKSIISTIALASLASVTLLYAASPAAARSCQQRYLDCQGRCMNNNTGGGIGGCITRTCIHQNDQCVLGEGGRNGGKSGAKPGGKVAGKGGGPVVRDHRGER